MRRVTDDPERVSLGILARNDYIDGAVLMKFLHETYGADAVRKLLTSDQPSFWLAMKVELESPPGLFVERFQNWLAQQK